VAVGVGEAVVGEADGDLDGVGDTLRLGVGDALPQAPLSVQTSNWPEWVSGCSPCVHHFEVYVWPLYETVVPPTYAVPAFHAGAVQPGGVVGDVEGLGDVVRVGDALGDVVFVGGGDTVPPVNASKVWLNCQVDCATPEQLS
jgi:hypothetical protein